MSPILAFLTLWQRLVDLSILVFVHVTSQPKSNLRALLVLFGSTSLSIEPLVQTYQLSRLELFRGQPYLPNFPGNALIVILMMRTDSCWLDSYFGPNQGQGAYW